MPDLGQLLTGLIRLVGDAIGASSLRLATAPTLAIGLVLLVFLSLVARPTSRWVTRDLGRLSGLGRALALAAEAGESAAMWLGTAGVARATAAVDRLQTLAGLSLLTHLAQAAARSGVRLRAVTNDPVTALLAEQALVEAHRVTNTPERAGRSTADYIGEGRPLVAAAALGQRERPGVALMVGGMGEESLLLLAAGFDAHWSTGGTASASQVSSILLASGAALVGGEMYVAGSDLRPAGHERIAALAANRLLLGALAVLLIGTVATLLGAPGLAGFLVGS